LAISADIRIATSDAQYALPEASIATCPGWSGSQRMVRLIGGSQTKYLALSGQRLSAEQALRAGLVHEVVDAASLMARAKALAEDMATKAPISLQLTKQLVNAATGEDRDSVLEGLAGALAASTEDAKEGINSFKEKRKAAYFGR
jgi:enoyl-CoA hydratase/carnithine racemase